MTEVKRGWYKALEHEALPEGRVKAVTCGLATVCMTHYEGEYAAIDNAWEAISEHTAHGDLREGTVAFVEKRKPRWAPYTG